MEAQDISFTIHHSLREEELNSWHGINLLNLPILLVTPYQKEFLLYGSEDLQTFWVVLDEDRTSVRDGYQIVYDEATDSFGLAIKTDKTKQGKEVGFLLSFYGSFVDALNNM